MQFVVRVLRTLGAAATDAEDLAQEVFVIAHRRIATFDASRSPRGWLYGIARNVARDHGRLARHREVAAGDALDRERAVPAPDDDVELLRRALATLDERHQDVVLLYELAECTVDETARALGVPVGTVKDRIRRARMDLRAAIAKLEVAA